MIFPDGSRAITWKGPDPRSGMETPIVIRMVRQTPAQRLADSDPSDDDPATDDRYEVLSSLTVADFANPADKNTWNTLARTKNVNGRVFTSVFNRTARTWTTTSPAGRTTTTTVDAQNRVTSRSVTGFHPVSYEYDTNGRIERITQGGRERTFTYDPTTGYLESTKNPLFAAGQLLPLDPEGPLDLLIAGTTYYVTRDGAGRVTQLTQPGADEISYSYDGNGNVTSVTPPDRLAHVFDYTEVNLLEAYEPPALGSDYANSDYSYLLDRQLDLVTHEVDDGGQGRTDTAIDVTYNPEGRPWKIDVLSGSQSVVPPDESFYRYEIKYQYEDLTQDGVAPHTIDVTDGGRIERRFLAREHRVEALSG